MRPSSTPNPTREERQRLNVYALMREVGIEPEGGVVAQFAISYSAAVRRCRICAHKAECDAWLSQARDNAARVPAFCPSVDILSELQFDRLPRRALAAAD